MNGPIQPITILISEDDHDIRVAYRYVLEEEGYLVITTTNGKDALKALQDHAGSVALVLLDMQMPIMDGNEFLKIKQGDSETSEIPVLVITASTHSIDYPVSEILRKPVNLDDLLEKTRALTQRSGKTN